MALSSLWQKALDAGASDIHVIAGHLVMYRIDGELIPQSEPVSEKFIKDLMKEFLSESQEQRYQAERDLDCSHVLADGTRFRINCHVVSGADAFSARVIPKNIPTLEELGLPEPIMNLARRRDGLVLFTGPTGSGKSTLLASMLQTLMQEQAINVITLEDPVEFSIPSGRGLMQQRELGTDFLTFPEGLKHVLRQDPDVVMVGEMRDLESIAIALTLAETGHLVLATLHTPNTTQSINRIIDVFPPHQQSQIRVQLSLSLQAVVAQRLIAKKGGGRVANREILIRTPAVANIIRDNRLEELQSVIQTNMAEGMVTFDKDLKRLIKDGVVEG